MIEFSMPDRKKFLNDLCCIAFGTWYPYFLHSGWDFMVDSFYLKFHVWWLDWELMIQIPSQNLVLGPLCLNLCNFDTIIVNYLNDSNIIFMSHNRTINQSADKTVTYNFETIHNIDEYATEFYDVRGSLKSWNMTVQYWLAMNVYRQFPVKALR